MKIYQITSKQTSDSSRYTTNNPDDIAAVLSNARDGEEFSIKVGQMSEDNYRAIHATNESYAFFVARGSGVVH